MLPTDYSFVFQFHKGTIRTNLSLRGKVYNSYFNSIKVQLELLMSILATAGR